jgi:hypothetical protein
MTHTLVTGLVALGVAASALHGQAQPKTFFKEKARLPDAEIQKIQQGQVVTKVLESGDPKYGLLVFGAVHVNAPVDRFAAVMKDFPALLQNKVYLKVQEFSAIGAPPKPADFAALTLEKKDVDELQTCKPGDCDIQIINVEDLQKRVDWKSPGRYEQVNQIIREKIYQGMVTYEKEGLKGLGSYKDRQQPMSLYEATKSMIELSYYLPKEKAPGIYNHVTEYPQGKLAGAEDHFYWEKIDFGQEPTIRVNHVSMFPQGAGAAKFVAVNKQLYATRYMRVAVQLFYCVPDTEKPDTGFYLIEMNDSRLPDFGSLKRAVVRKVATGKAVDATRDTLQMYQKMLNGN